MIDDATEQDFSVHTIKFDSENAELFLAFARAVTAHDGTPPFSEQTLVEVHKASRQSENAQQLQAVIANKNKLGSSSPSLIGAVVALIDDDGVATLEGAVAPDERGQGVGRALAENIADILAKDSVVTQHLWIHQIQGEGATGERKAAETLARSFNFSPVRELRKMQLWLTDESRQEILCDFQQVELPSGITLDTFTSQDEKAWLHANAEAFADHPEQGMLTLEDLKERQASDWFRAEGFILARAPKELAGFHWTKVPPQDAEELEGEVYAVGVVPAWQGKKLGKILTLAGMKYLVDFTDDSGRSLDKIALYVDADNDAAVNLYKSLGFVEETVDVMYSNQVKQA